MKSSSSSMSWLEKISVGFLTLVLAASILVPLWPGLDPARVDLTTAYLSPPWMGSGSWQHILGTDPLGRDILVRLVFGARISIGVALASSILAAHVGVAIGAVAGFYRGWLDGLFSRVMDAQLSLPFVVLALPVSVALGPNPYAVIPVIAAASWVGYARVVRSETMVIENSDFIALGRVAGLGGPLLLWRHVVPNILPSVIVLLSLNFCQAILYEASLSFLGLGVQPPAASWGLMIAEGRTYLEIAPWVPLAPALCLALVALCGNIVANFVRASLDPKLKV
jgi:peptide/nickel transport system permease protein